MKIGHKPEKVSNLGWKLFSFHELYSVITSTNWTYYTQACVRDPNVIVIGTITINQTERNLICQDWKPHTCLNTSLFNSNHSYVTLHWRLGVWLPLTQNRPWELSPDMHTLLTVLNTIFKRSECFTGLHIATIMGIIAITTTAAVAGIALHQMVQTTTFVQEWHKNASSAWGAQTHIDEEINSRLVDVERNLHPALLLLEEV